MKHIPDYARRPLWHTIALALAAWAVVIGVPFGVYAALCAVTRFLGGAR